MHLRCLVKKNLLQSTIWFLNSHYFNIMVNISCIATEQGVDRLFVTVTGLNQLSDQEKIPLTDLRGAGSMNYQLIGDLNTLLVENEPWRYSSSVDMQSSCYFSMGKKAADQMLLNP
ncbi:hypothetical protein A4A49_35724 [Nicotiana attenuata]|uniref:Uncharacterized protein n=1 Tax=Nicotiana attenuata TaxID=49451 RepID=A0A314KIS9_NICAT|nr:hypothetical protein A4A49_35724 [Nicotiana attenuata]